MPIYRGPGGPGDATGDSASEVLLAVEAANAASASATNAATSATNASTSASSAATSASSAASSAASASSTLAAAALKANNLSDLTSASTARTNLGLGTAATTDSTAYATATQGATADTAYADRYKWDGGATGLVAATGRTSLGLVASATTDTTNASNISSGTLDSARLPAFTGDATSTAGTSALTLATVNSNVGSFGSSSSIPVVTVNAKGLVTAVSTSTVAGGQYFGSAATKAIAYNSTSIAENITTTSGNNCLSVGPITIATGNTVTIATGQRWVIL